MKQVILGTAGHIDHGKTSLIKALTNIDTDRLKEEKKRGITIELGFAYMDLPDGNRLGIVDVPGHERFVRHMVAGASGMDLVALVIAADEGVMPQTREHLEICQLLRVKKGLVILTKIDLVEDPEWIEIVEEDIKDFLKGTFLENAPIVAVSSATGEGLENLTHALVDLVSQVESKSADGPFRLPVDRVFTMKGFGTVVTGTSISGKVRVGESVIIYPPSHKTKVRGLQVHSEEVEEVLPGQRTAINLQSTDRGLIQRGYVMATPGAFETSHMTDVYLELLPSAPRPLKNRAKVRFHTGTAENLATLVLLDQEELAPGQKAFAQIRSDQPIAVLRGDRYVLRSYSPVHTVGGGTVLHPAPRKHKGHHKMEAAKSLQILLQGNDPDLLLWHVRDAECSGLSEHELQVRANVTGKSFQKLLQQFISQKKIILYDKENRHLIHPEVLAKLQETILKTLADYHDRFPLKSGMPKEELAAQLPRQVDGKLYNFVLRELAQQNRVAQEKEWVRLVTHKVGLTKEEEAIRQKIEETYKKAALQPPSFREVAAKLPGSPGQHRDVLEWIFSQGILIKVKEELYFHASALESLKQQVTAFLKEHGEMTPPQFKNLAQVSRKYAIPLLEYLDSQKVTIRVGDVRRLREGVN
jgi:selenocysteine-specific elongation factor